jgi:hypothetical protein
MSTINGSTTNGTSINPCYLRLDDKGKIISYFRATQLIDQAYCKTALLVRVSAADIDQYEANKDIYHCFWRDGHMTLVENMTEIRSQAQAHLNNLTRGKITVGFSSIGSRFSCTDYDQANITNMYALKDKVDSGFFKIKDKKGAVLALSSEDIAAIYLDMVSYISACIEQNWKDKKQVEAACTKLEVDAIKWKAEQGYLLLLTPSNLNS